LQRQANRPLYAGLVVLIATVFLMLAIRLIPQLNPDDSASVGATPAFTSTPTFDPAAQLAQTITAAAATLAPTPTPTLDPVIGLNATLDALYAAQTATAASPTPSPTSTPYRSEFDQALDQDPGDWYQEGSGVSVENGVLRLTKGRGAFSAVYRYGLLENRGFRVLFQYEAETPATLYFNIASGDYSGTSFRGWYFGQSFDHPQQWAIYSCAGNDCVNNLTQQSDLIPLQPDTPYYLQTRIGDGGEIYAQVWAQADPSAFLLDHLYTPDAAWDERVWYLFIRVEGAALLLENYAELFFTAQSTPAPLPPTELPHITLWVSVAGARVYAGPSRDFEVLLTVARVTLPVSGISADGRWLQVMVNGQSGWVENIRNIITVNGDLEGLPVIAGPTPTP
jgi:hypothetical protein